MTYPPAMPPGDHPHDPPPVSQVPAPYDPGVVQPAVAPPQYHYVLDPIVPPPHSGIGGWFDRVTDVLAHNVVPMALAIALGVALPSAVWAIVADVVIVITDVDTNRVGMPKALGVFALLTPFALVTWVCAAITTVAVLRLVAHRASGHHLTVLDAFRLSLGRGLVLAAWGFIVGVATVIGLVLCVLPGLYVAVVFGLVAPVVLFEAHQSPLPRSASLVHSNFGAALGRAALLLVAALIYGLVTALPGVVINAFAQYTALELPAAIGVDIFEALLAIPSTMVFIVVVLVTYAQLRSPDGTLTARHLAAEAQGTH